MPIRAWSRPTLEIAAAGLLAALAWASSADAGESRCWIDKGALVAPAAFGDIAGDFLIDLSALTSSLHDTAAQSHGLVGASARQALVVAGQHLADADMAIVDLDARTMRFDTVINGVLGMDVLGRFTIEIDPSPCRLRLSLKPPAAPKGGVRLPIRDVGGRPAVPAVVTDGTLVRAGLFAIDTADWATTVAGARFSGTPSVASDSPVRVRAVEFAGRLFEQVPAAIAPEGPDGAMDAIGMAVLSRRRLVLDVKDGWLDVAPLNTR